MRLLPCASAQCEGKGAALPKSAAFPGGEPWISANYVQGYKCHRCKAQNKLSRERWNQLPSLTVQDFERLAKDQKGRVNEALRDMPVRDFMGQGFSKAEASDLFGAGFNVNSLEPLERKSDV